MTTLKNLKGTAIQFLDEDPVEYAGSWASGGSLNTSRKDGGGFGAGATNGIVAGGYGGAPAAAGNYVESYNGTSWTETTELNAGRGWSPMGAGTQTAGLVAGGQPLPPASGYTAITEEWNGSSWTESGDLNIARANLAGTGSQTAAVAFGGSNPGGPGPAASIDTENYNGTSWTETANMNSAASSPKLHSRGSPYTSVISVHSSNTESWNGSAWTEVAEVNTSRTNGAGAGESNTSAVIFGGSSQNAKTESWDGTSWTEVNDLSTGRADGGTTGGTASNALYAGGETTVYVGTTEEWSFPPATASTLNEGDMWFNSTSSTLKGYGTAAGVPAGTWASGGALNTGRNGVRGAGVSKAAVVVFGGNDGSVTGKTENYNGSAWTETTDMNTGKTNSVGTGTYTAAIAAYDSTAETWNGTSWTEVSELSTPRQEVGSFGTQTSALAIGNQNAASAIVEQWDGSSWTEVGDLTTAVGATTGFGTTSAGHAVGGGNPGAVANNQIWNGSSWSEGADMNQARYFAGASGTTTAGLVFAGYKTTPATEISNTESWNGTSFTEVNDLSTARFTGAPAHNSSSIDALLAGGNPSNKTNTEEWTATAAVATVTTS